MNYKIIITCLLIFVCFSLHAQDEKLRVAVLDPTSSGTGIDDGTKMAVREIISSVFVNTGKYTIVERSLIDRVMQEQKFSNSGAVDDSQASEIGKLLSAKKIVLSVIAQVGKSAMLSIKLVDVNSASVEKQKTQMTDANQLLDLVEPATKELIKEIAVAPATTINQPVKQPMNSDQRKLEKPKEENLVASENPDNKEVKTDPEILGKQTDTITVIPNELDHPYRIETTPGNINLQNGKSNAPTTLFTIGGISIVAGIAASIFLTKDYVEYGYGTKIVGKEHSLVYAASGIVIGGFCIGRGIYLKKKAKIQPNSMGYYINHSRLPSCSRLDFVAIKDGGGLRLTF